MNRNKANDRQSASNARMHAKKPKAEREGIVPQDEAGQGVQPPKHLRLLDLGFQYSEDAIIFSDHNSCVAECNHAAEKLLGRSRQEIMGKKCWEVMHGTDSPPPDCPLLDPESALRRGTTEVCLHDHWYKTTFQPVLDPDTGSLLGIMHVFSDITEQKTTAAALSQKTESLSALLEISRALATSTDLPTLLQSVVDHAASLCRFDVVTIRLLEGDELVAAARHPAGLQPFDESAAKRFVKEHPHMLRALKTMQPVVIPDTSQADLTEAEQAATRNLEFASVAFVPLVYKSESIGILVAGNRSLRDFSSEDVELMTALAGISALEIAERRAAEQLEANVARLQEEVLRRQTAEEQLRASEARFLRLAEHARDLIYRYEFRPTRGFTYVSPGATAVTGYSPEEHYADPDLGLKLVHPDDRPLLEQMLQGKIDENTPLVLRWVRKDGKVIWTKQNNLLIRDETGRVVAVEGTARDITAEMEAEAARQEAEERYRSLVELAPVIVIVVQDGRVVFVNPAGATILGADSPEEIIGLRTEDIVAPSELAEARYRRDRTLAGVKGLYPVQGTWLKRDGTPLRLEISAAPLAYQGRSALLVVAIDLTARKEMEQALEQERQRFKKIADSFPGAICLLRVGTDGHLSLPYASPMIEELTGLAPEQLAADAALLRARVHPADLRRMRESMLESARTLGPWDCEFRYHHPTKDRVWLETHALPSRDTDGSTLWSGVLLDITQRKKAEQEHEATMARLFEAQRAESVGRLAGGIAHDFNNMLSVILGYAQGMLLRLSPDDPDREDVEQILQAAERSAHLTRQLLAFSRRQTLRPQSFSLNAHLRGMEAMLRGLVGEDVGVRLALDEGVGQVSVDPGQFEQMIVNLALNAREAMPQGGQLTIATSLASLRAGDEPPAPGLRPGTYAKVSVTDSGHGIPDDVLPHIFEPFFTTKKKGEGTGLGLAVVEGVAKQSGGAIAVSTELGKGTTFDIYLPVASPPLVAPGKKAAEREPATAARPRRILVVEDEDSLRALFERMLGEFGYHVTVAANASEALDLMEKGLKPDLVLSDVVMPGMSGPAMVTRLRETHPGIRVILMSGYPDDAIDHHGGVHEGVPFLQKPVTMAALAAKLREVFGDLDSSNSV